MVGLSGGGSVGSNSTGAYKVRLQLASPRSHQPQAALNATGWCREICCCRCQVTGLIRINPRDVIVGLPE